MNALYNSRFKVAAFVLLFAGLLLFGAAPAGAETPIPALTGRIVDNGGMLSYGAKESLTNLLEAYEQATTNQIVVATIPSLENEEIEQFSIRLADAWQIGQAGKDNGAILLIARDDRRMRIEIGYGLEGVINDARAGDILRDVLIPAFQRGDYDTGVTESVSAMIRHISPDFEYEGLADVNMDGDNEVGSVFGGLFSLFAVIMIVLGALGGRSKRHYKRGLTSSIGQAILWSLLSSSSGSNRNRHRGGGGFG
ncbi:MAG TPA: methanol dehydrogenase, partial [Firmicutes bacterium]|nr:methanol dehydrogenase [Bacillota bacterium]